MAETARAQQTLAPEQLAERLVGGTRLADSAYRRQLWEGGLTAIEALEELPEREQRVDIPQPEIIVRMPEPDVSISQAEPKVEVQQARGARAACGARRDVLELIVVLVVGSGDQVEVLSLVLAHSPRLETLAH